MHKLNDKLSNYQMIDFENVLEKGSDNCNRSI